MKRRTFIATGLGLSLATRLKAELQLGRLGDAGMILDKSVAAGQLAAASLFVQSGRESYARAFGTAGSSDAIFLLASITKPIAITAVMTLFDQGEFDLDDKVVKFIPEFDGDARRGITIRQLLTHVSGLPDQLPQNAQLRAAHSPLSAFVEGAIKTPLLFPPGSRYSYSSMGILLATEIARRITEKPIARLVEERVIQPLDLRHSALGLGRFALEDVLPCQVESAARESGAGDPAARSWDWNSIYWRKLGVPWGAAHGSAPDVARWLREFLHPTGRVLKPETCRLMVRNHNPPQFNSRGLAFDVGADIARGPAGDRTFGHTGSTGTICWADPATDTTCVILTTLPARAVSAHPRDQASAAVARAIV